MWSKHNGRFILQIRENDVSSDTEDIDDLKKAIQISKLDPLTPDFVPQNLVHTSTKPHGAPEELTNKKKTTKQNRNVALTSILKLSGIETEVEKGLEPKRLPNSVDFSANMTASLEKVNGWLDTQLNNDSCDAKNIVSSDPGSKKKISTVKESDKFVNSLTYKKLVQPPPKHPKDILSLDPSTMFRKKVLPKVVPVVECKKETVKSRPGCEKYVPSSNADEYYKKYLEQSKVHEMVHADVWTQAEMQMKEIDNKRLVSFYIRNALDLILISRQYIWLFGIILV